ncbi:MAG: hypothetical protein AB7P07_11215 [Hyphomonadaceae bacterium]
MIRWLLPACALALAACASTPVYAPAASPGGVGYSESAIESNRYFVTYRAGGEADAALIQDYALLRAAELTLSRGAEWFWVDRRTLDAQAVEDSGPRFGVSVGGASFGGRTATGVGVGVNFPLGGGGGGERARAATLEIRFGQGPKPDDANAYDATAVAANLRSRLAAQ